MVESQQILAATLIVGGFFMAWDRRNALGALLYGFIASQAGGWETWWIMTMILMVQHMVGGFYDAAKD